MENDEPPSSPGWEPSSGPPTPGRSLLLGVVAVVLVATFVLCCVAARQAFDLMFLDVDLFP